MTPSDVLMIVMASAAGFALLGAALVVMEGMHPFVSGRWFTALGWLGTVCSGAYLAVVPGYTRTPVSWYVAMIAVTAAVVIWQNIEAICAEAKRRAKRRVLAPTIGAGLLAGCMAVAPAQGARMLADNLILLEPDEVEAGAQAGGIVVTTKARWDRMRADASKCSSGA